MEPALSHAEWGVAALRPDFIPSAVEGPRVLVALETMS
jgi:hypothetical protein